MPRPGVAAATGREWMPGTPARPGGVMLAGSGVLAIVAIAAGTRLVLVG